MEANLPVVTRFFWPPEIPRCIWSPTMVSAQMSSPSICSKDQTALSDTPTHRIAVQDSYTSDAGKAPLA